VQTVEYKQTEVGEIDEKYHLNTDRILDELSTCMYAAKHITR